MSTGEPMRLPSRLPFLLGWVDFRPVAVVAAAGQLVPFSAFGPGFSRAGWFGHTRAGAGYSGKQFTAPLLGVEYSDGKTRARVAFDNATETEVWLVYDRLRKRWKGQKYRYRIKGAGYVTIPPEY